MSKIILKCRKIFFLKYKNISKKYPKISLKISKKYFKKASRNILHDKK